MIKIYRTDDRSIHELDSIQDGSWIQLIHPTRAEGTRIANELNISRSYVSRIEKKALKNAFLNYFSI